ncbi:MAG: penicillin acylase family protein [Gemmatimonadaceae bacterium]
MITRGIAAVALTALLFAGFRRVGPLPPLGELLDPANGVWAGAAATSFSRDQSLAIPGLEKPVRVIIDDRGVPHIFAGSDLDAYRALGFVVARDRLFQMETQTRAAAGTISEWAGSRALPSDRRARSLGLAWAAERKLADYDTTSAGYRAIVAYTEGVNSWIESMRPRDLPVEYRLLNTRPGRWEPVHSLYFLSRMSMTLALNDATLKRLRAQSLVGAAAADALFPVNSPIQEPIQPNGLGAPRFDFGDLPAPGAPDLSAADTHELREGTLAALERGGRPEGGDALGSNSWAVAPSRSSTGHAMLAGDPHLDLTLPSVWYEMHLVVPGRFDVAGVGFPGVPGVIVGFNRDVAWTFTNTGSDVNDFYKEVVDDSISPARYQLDGTWRPLESRVEVYRDSRGSVIATDTVRYTHRGPMQKVDGAWLSMRWTLYEKSREIDNFLSLAPARNADEWLAAMHDYIVPTQNGLVADRAGNIAIRSTGSYPTRPGNGRGDLILDGSISASDWTGRLAVERYPFARNPEQGFLSSANQQPVDPMHNAAYMGSDWDSPWRAMRINSLLRENAKVTPDQMRRFQTDPGSARADAFVPFFLEAARREEAAGRGDRELSEAAAALGEWDRRYVRESRRAALFESAMSELARRTWDELIAPGDTAGVPGYNLPEAQTLLRIAQHRESVWWDDRRTPAREDRDAIFAASLKAGYAKLVGEKGAASSDEWLWSRIRHANINHLLRIPAFSAMRIPVQGGPSTLSPSGGSGEQGASWRMVVELGPEIRAWGVYPGGQSGAPASRRYKDRLSRWTMGQLDQILYPRTPEDLDRKRIISTLNLSPARQ